MPAVLLLAGLPLFPATPASAQASVKVLFWGGPATTSHNVPAFRDTIAPYLTAQGMAVHYRETAPYRWLHADSLAAYDVMLVYTTNQNANDLTQTQLTALTDWLASGRVMVALHGATNTFINNNTAIAAAWRALTGGQFADHGPADGSGHSGTMTYTALGTSHPALNTTTALPPSAANSGGSPYWDEGRRHNSQFAADTIVLARAYYTTPAVTSLPWIWVRPQGNGWVYYNASGHDGQVWTRPEFKNQIAGALHWGNTIKTTGLRGQAALRALVRSRGNELVIPLRSAYSLEVTDMQGRRRYFHPRSIAGSHDLGFLPAGTYGVSIQGVNRRSERKESFKTLFLKRP